MASRTRKPQTPLRAGAAILAAATAAASFAAGVPAFADSVPGQAVEVRAAYLKTSPRLGWNNIIELVGSGTHMQVLWANRYWLNVQLPDGRTGYITANPYWVQQISAPAAGSASPAAGSASPAAGSASPPPANSGSPTAAAANPAPAFTLPPGVHMDPSITPIAGENASASAKFAAVLQVAQSKLGTPYIWGHNEDRGQYGFDCSNFTEYVFHHALGYLFSTSSKAQFESVGTPVPLSQMQPGDLLFFSDNSNPTGSAHVGIYIGNGQMIQEGGGLGKVGYLSVTTGYWSHHLVAAHRMF